MRRSQSSTASVASSILEYRQLHGRTYHSEKFTANYFIPNDDRQLASLDMVLVTIPPSPLPAESEFADQFPNASVIGTDLSPCQPQWAPPNVRFEIDDATLEWTWNANHFDFIHIRYILGGIQDWTALLKEAYRCCAPGGWVESVEYEVDFRSDDGTTELEPVLASFGELFREAERILNCPFFVREIQQQAFDDAGFVDKRVVTYKIPVGSWPKDRKLAEVGRFSKAATENDLQGYTQMLWQSVLQRPSDEYHVWLSTMLEAIRNPKVHSYVFAYVVYGRKPE
ncbi:uncharacterized protein CPUR_01527 [Claviceps purpurea 20.1]|uniref:Methyltransferase n=1 Tax=Claviceps purpurea (strain 20.1) TaxID=1111077 RepID=M1W6V4_CLAP2|nr:uncharacterized protein CPUR_01527 [Claviceps purpurea 20.1]